MTLLVVGSLALDTVETPFGQKTDALGGSATFFAHAAGLLHPVRVVGVVGNDFPEAALAGLRDAGADLAGVERADGESFRWHGKYSYDFQNRETLETRLGVFADFQPKIPDAFRDSKYVFLGNIDPVLQVSVLDQIASPTLVACDTMNYWIDGRRDALMTVLERTDVLLVNDAEARELSGDWNIYRAARWITQHGPRTVVIKQGEFGAVLVHDGTVFHVPAFPLEEVFDPTGAGDAFAGGFVGHLARSDDTSPANLRRAMVYGAAMGSFAVGSFSVERFTQIGPADVTARVREFADLVRFDIDPGASS
jgi:sugar/nucleoside kinase (ribokinase family)